ncbi:MAG: DNA translocase FtsK 4TM domain-containing protein [Gemmatimonadaceae bacterium]|nr:DNA translocase FtsK 4TM domain-containing protein [Gemmatimonadaceae bacterium]MDQ3519031.1 DNA translocase FtsK [Gemmatimonadota bacterium]
MWSVKTRRELSAVALLLLAFFVGASLIAGFRGVEAPSCSDSRELFGPVGACLRVGLVGAIGWPAALLIPALSAVLALRMLGSSTEESDRLWLVFLAGFVLLLPVGLGLGLGLSGGEPRTHPATGLWGSLVAYYLARPFGPAGAWVVLAFAFVALTVITLKWNPVRLLLRGGEHRTSFGGGLAGTREEDARTAPAERSVLQQETTDEEPTVPSSDRLLGGLVRSQERPKRGKKSKADQDVERTEKIAAEMEAFAVPAGAQEELPPLDLLTPAPIRNADLSRRELEAMGVKLKDALRTFRVEAEIVGRTTGPVVTQFEVEPAAGVKVRQIANLANDLALAMRAQSIRIVAPIPGRGAVGVEVPNPVAEMVAFRELLESREFQHSKAILPIALGKDLEGKPVIADLAKMPHLLIAGATGSGKSVCINTLITSLSYRHTPRTLRFLMVDPKMVELSVYNTLPHLRHKVITDNRDAAAVLKWAVMEMQERYQLFAANGCRNIQDFNRRALGGAPLMHPKNVEVAFENLTYSGGILPYIVVVIDELADLMMTVQGEIETPLAMLAQKARAIGLHMILATQRPSVNVITGLIKANFSSRIAFRVASQVDSRTILDGIGAEALLGNGDMLFIPPGKSEPARLQGAFISSEDTERLMGWYAERREAKRREFELQGLIPEEPLAHERDILEEVREREQSESGHVQDGNDADELDRDKLFREAAEIVIQYQQGSTSLLQRRLKVGYGRAARIIDQLHDAGVLGPAEGSKGRDVLIGSAELDAICRRE